jgi:hypothetical protein
LSINREPIHPNPPNPDLPDLTLKEKLALYDCFLKHGTPACHPFFFPGTFISSSSFSEGGQVSEKNELDP